MFEKSLRRDQENIPIGKRQHLSSQVPPQRRDIRLAENRVLQETQQNVKPNSLAFKPQRLSQEHSTISNTSGQYEKINGTHISQKGIDKEQKIPLKDATSPTSAIGVSDISYRIVNEILNAQHGNRNQLKMKAGSRMMERTKSPRVLAQTSSDNLTDAIRGVKAAFEENEELNSIDGKINDAKTKLEDKKKMLEAGRKRYEEDAQAVEEKEKILNREHNRLKGKLEKSGTKIAVKDKPILSTDKEKLKQLRGELLNYEKELSRLDKILQKQEKEKSEIEKTVNQEFEKQVEDLEEAMLSIEEQKLEIYAKLNEAILAHNEVLEQKAMLKEDLGGRLIQRADLVAQREDLEQAMDTFKQNNAAETEFYFIENQINQELGALEKALYDLYVKRDNLKKQLRNKEHKDNKSNGILNLERMKKDWFELCEIERLLSHKAEEVGLDGIDSVYSKILGQYGVHIEKNKIWEYMLDIAEQTSEEEPEDSVRIRLKGKIREEAIENWKEWESEGLSEILSKAEQTDFINLYEKFCEKIKDYDEDVAEERRVHETNDQPEEELKKVEKQIQEKEARKEELESELDKRREKLESAVISETETAFQAYLQDQAGTFETIKNKHGIEAAEDMKRQYHREFLQIAQNDLLDKLSHYRSLQDDIKYLEQTIKNNTTTVDEKVLPELQNLLPSLEEDSLLVTALKQQQIHLLETEDEVAEQLNCVVENRTEKIRLCQQNYDENQSIPPAETQEAKNSLERRIVTAKEEISKVENHMIEVDKLAIEGHSEEIRLQSELKGIDKELNELVTIKKPSLHELHIQIGVWDKELKDLEKSLEQLEMQKLGLEQQFIEQNYLNDELVHQGITPKSTMHKRSSKTLNFDLKENTSVERQPTEPTHVEKEKKDKSRMTQSLKNNMIRGLMMEMDLGSTKNASRSPLDRVSPSLPATQKNKPKRDFFDNLNILSQQELSAEKGLLNTWTCFSPPGSILLGGISQKIQEKLNDSKEKGRERKSHGHRDDLMQFRSQQKRSAQRQNTASDSIDKPNPVNIDTRTNSLPQAYNPNIRKSEEGPIFLNQNLTPKGPEILGRAPSANQTRESYNEETLQRSYMTYFDKPKNSGPTSEGLNVSSPKALNLHINSLMSQAGIQNGAQNYHSAKEPEKALSEVQLRYREFIRQSGDLPKGDLLRENFTTEELFPRHREEETEGERSKTRVLRGTKPSLVDKSLLNKTGDESGISRKIDAGSSFKNRDDSTNFLRQSRDLNDTVSKKKPHSLQEIIGEIRRGRKEMEMHKEAPKETQEDENRSKSIDVQKGKNQKAIGHTGEKLSFRDRAEGSHGKLELSETKNVHPIRMLVTPSSKTPSGLLSESKEFQELKSKINEHSIQETLFFDLIKPLLQGSFLYKKFTNAQSLKRAAFDPLMADIYPIEACGYGIRSIKLHPNLDRIEIKHTYKPGVELTLPLDRVLRAMVPQITMDVLRIQKKIVGSAQQTEEEIPELFADKRGVNNLNNGIEKYLSCSYYPFSLLLDRNGKVEFVASSYSVFKEWINGINMLLRYKKQLPQLRQKLKKTQ